MKQSALRRAIATTLLPLACGCRTAPLPAADPCRFNQQTLAEALAQRSAGKALHPFQILVLSGGGAYGAWGAGVLAGWRENPRQPRPRFDVVTAISTGALQASAAFLGEPTDDASLRDAYTTIDCADIFRPRFWPLLPLLNSVYSTGPLARQIERVVDDDVIDRVGRAASTGRKLYVGTTDLDRSTLTIWDMTCLAASRRPDRHERYRRILLAATAIPVLFPPVRIDGDLHADGGTRADLFLDQSLLPIVRQSKSIAAAKGLSSSAPTVWVLLNGQPPGITAATPNRIIPLAIRALENVLAAGQQADISAIAALAAKENFDARICAIPPNTPGPSSAIDFDPRAMSQLYQAALRAGASRCWTPLSASLANRQNEPKPGATDATQN